MVLPVYDNNKSGKPKAIPSKKAKPEYVDLGLSVCWASFNLGASKPEESGSQFAWGETEPKPFYCWNYFDTDDGGKTFKDYYTFGGKTRLDAAHDAAHVHWSRYNRGWRMPSKAEWKELTDRCEWTLTETNGINGFNVTGPNGNSIFLPIPKYPISDESCYWSSELSNVTSYQAYSIRLSEYGNEISGDDIEYGFSYRCLGFYIRPVIEINKR